VLVHSQGPCQSPTIQLPQAMSIGESLMSSSNGMNVVCSKPLSTTVAVALHPQVTQLVHPSHQGALNAPNVSRSMGATATVALPVGAYNTLPQNPTIAIASTGPMPGNGPPTGITMPQSKLD